MSQKKINLRGNHRHSCHLLPSGKFNHNSPSCFRSYWENQSMTSQNKTLDVINRKQALLCYETQFLVIYNLFFFYLSPSSLFPQYSQLVSLFTMFPTPKHLYGIEVAVFSYLEFPDLDYAFLDISYI